MAVSCLGYADWGAVECTCLDCKVPQLKEHITSAVPFETIKQLGDVLTRMPTQNLPAYKALIAATECQHVEDALVLAEQLDEHILSSAIASPEDVAAEELAVSLSKEDIKLIRPHINLHTYGQALLASRQQYSDRVRPAGTPGWATHPEHRTTEAGAADGRNGAWITHRSRRQVHIQKACVIGGDS